MSFEYWTNKPTLGAQLNLAHPLSKGLVGLWLMNEGQGSEMADFTPYRNRGVLTGAAAWDGTHDGYAMSLGGDGSGDYVSLGAPLQYNFGSGDFCFSLWARQDDSSVTDRHMFTKDMSGARQWAFVLNDNTDSVLIGYFVGGSLVRLDSAGTAPLDTLWHHYVGQRVGDSFEIYLDANLVDSGTTVGTHGTMDQVTADLRIGARQFVGFENEFNGDIDYVTMWNRSRSAKEIASLYANPFQQFTPLIDPAVFMDLAVAGVGGILRPFRPNVYR